MATMRELLEAGHTRMRRPVWVEPGCYLHVGPLWGHLYSRQTQQALGEPTPQRIILLPNDDDDGPSDWEPWTGARDPADKHGLGGQP